MLSDNEKWIEGHEGRYCVSSDGRVFSFLGAGRTKRELVGGLGYRVYKGVRTNQYRVVCLYIRGVSKTKQEVRYIHRLVAEAFITKPENKNVVNHIDGNKQNNSVHNLEWVSESENSKHAWSTGLMEPVLASRKSNSCPFKKLQVDRETTIDDFLVKGYSPISNKNILSYITEEDLIRNKIPPELLHLFRDSKKVVVKTDSLLNEWIFRFAVMSIIENYNYSLSQLQDKIGMDTAQISKIRSRKKWVEVWDLYDKYKGHSRFDPLFSFW